MCAAWGAQGAVPRRGRAPRARARLPAPAPTVPGAPARCGGLGRTPPTQPPHPLRDLGIIPCTLLPLPILPPGLNSYPVPEGERWKQSRSLQNFGAPEVGRVREWLGRRKRQLPGTGMIGEGPSLSRLPNSPPRNLHMLPVEIGVGGAGSRARFGRASPDNPLVTGLRSLSVPFLALPPPTSVSRHNVPTAMWSAGRTRHGEYSPFPAPGQVGGWGA